jgi:hypothetical protein
MSPVPILTDSHIRSDHGSHRWLINFENPEGQLARWLKTLSAYDYYIVHRPGRVHRNADALANYSFDTILDLGQYGSHTYITGVRIKNKIIY